MAFDCKQFGMNSGIPFIKITDRVEVTVNLTGKRVSGRVCDSSLTLSKNAPLSQSGLYGGSPTRRTKSANRRSARSGSQSGSTLR